MFQNIRRTGRRTLAADCTAGCVVNRTPLDRSGNRRVLEVRSLGIAAAADRPGSGFGVVAGTAGCSSGRSHPAVAAGSLAG